MPRSSMVGNDVVDLLDADADPLGPRERFDARVGRAAEVRAIAAARDPARERWCHWAAKEAAYKLLRRRDRTVIFSPIRFEVELAPAPAGWSGGHVTRAGVVVHGAQRVAISLGLDAGAVHAIASGSEATDETALVCGVRRLDEGEDASPAALGEAVRRLALGSLATSALFASGPDAAARLSIVKRDRMPELALDGRPIDAARVPVLSLSHHGRVVAFACRVAVSGAGAVRRLAS